MKRPALVVALLVVAGVALAADMQAGTATGYAQPVGGLDNGGQVRNARVTDGGVLRVKLDNPGDISASGAPSVVYIDGGQVQATQGGVWVVGIDGGVGINNFPASYPVTGTFWQSIQPVSGTVEVAVVDGGVQVTGGELTCHAGNAPSTPWPVRPSGPDAGPVWVDSSANIGTDFAEICVPSAYDGGAHYDGGAEGWSLETYNVLVTPAGMRGFELCNRSTAALVSFTCGAQSASVPIANKVGRPLGIRSAATAAADCASVNLTNAACPQIHMVATANQTSTTDGGTGCVAFFGAR